MCLKSWYWMFDQILSLGYSFFNQIFVDPNEKIKKLPNFALFLRHIWMAAYAKTRLNILLNEQMICKKKEEKNVEKNIYFPQTKQLKRFCFDTETQISFWRKKRYQVSRVSYILFVPLWMDSSYHSFNRHTHSINK